MTTHTEPTRCPRAESTRDCPFSHDWWNGHAYVRRDHAPITPMPEWRRRSMAGRDPFSAVTDTTGLVAL
jgi:hypothetical protein